MSEIDLTGCPRNCAGESGRPLTTCLIAFSVWPAKLRVTRSVEPALVVPRRFPLARALLLRQRGGSTSDTTATRDCLPAWNRVLMNLFPRTTKCNRCGETARVIAWLPRRPADYSLTDGESPKANRFTCSVSCPKCGLQILAIVHSVR
jgi:hypothetical protein